MVNASKETTNDSPQAHSISKNEKEDKKIAPPSKKISSSLKPPRQWLGFSVLFLLVFLLIFIVYYQNWQLYQLQHQQQNTLDSALLTLKNEQQQAALKWEDTLQKNQKKLNDELQITRNNLQQALQQTFYQKQDWLLLKARSYLEFAQINAHWGDELNVTIALLEQADDLLKNFSDPNALSIRQAIAEEIASIKANPPIDIAGFLSQLDALQTMVMKLPLKAFSSPKSAPRTATNPVSAEATKPSSWRRNLKENLAALEKLVVIKRYDEKTLPLFSPTYQLLLRASIVFTLQEAEWAVLKKNVAVYNYALSKALKTINYAFATDSSSTQSLITQLKALQAKPIISVKPNINRSLSLLNHWIDNKDKPALSSASEGASS